MVCSPHVGPQITYCLFAQQPRGFLLLDFLDMTHTLYVNTAPAVMLCLYPYYLSTSLMYLFFMYTIHAPHESAIWKICVHAWNCAEALKSCISTNISVYPEMTSFFFLLAVFQGQLDSHFFFSSYGRAGGEDGFLSV